MVNENQLKLTPEANEAIAIYFDDIIDNKEKNFSNGRFVKNIFEELLRIQANRLFSNHNININDMNIIQTTI